MVRTPQQRALDILEASLGLPDAERTEFLQQAASSDPEVAAELRRLEKARTSAPQLLATSPGAPGDSATALPPPAQVGAFRIIELIGRGGMGAVYRAQRNDGLFDQQVAIKLLARKRWSGDLEQMFADERRILARLEHRNIARLYDGGVTSDGQSYFVMEYVDGCPITEYCERNRLGLRARIELLGQLCRALQFAHQQLVVHADIKPSNVLVTGDGSVKLLDFGIARLADREVREQASARGGAPAALPTPMTTAYAAPERVAGGVATVAGDVFSLGVLMRNLIEAPATLEAVAPDLVAIVRKASAPVPTDRYGSVAELDLDLRRWLQHLPVQAVSAQNFGYRARLFLTRNRTAVSIGLLTLLGLSAATVISTRLYFAAERARTAEAQRAAEIRDLNTFVTLDLSDQMVNRPGMAEAAWQTLSTTRVRLEALAASNPADVKVQIELGRNIARIVGNLIESRPRHVDLVAVRSDLEKAEIRLHRLEPQGRDLPDYWALRSEMAGLDVKFIFQQDGNVALASRRADDATKYAARALRLDPGSADATAAQLLAKIFVAGVQNGQGRPQDAVEVLDVAIRSAHRTAVANATKHQRLSLALAEIAFMRCDILRWSVADDRALAQCRQTESELRGAIRRVGPLVHLESRLAYTLFLVASMLPAAERSAEALALLDEARLIDQRILHFGEHQRIAGEALVIEAARANSLAALGRFDEARASAASLLAERRRRHLESPQDHGRHREVATALRRVGEVELQAGVRIAACAAFREAGQIWDGMERDGTLLGFDLAQPSGQVPWIRDQLRRCPP